MAPAAGRQRPSWLQNLLHSRHDADIIGLAIPAFISIILDPLMGIVDTAIVGRISTAALGAAGLGSVVINLSNGLFSFLLIATTPRVAAAFANEDMPAASQTIAQTLWVAVALGLLVVAGLWTQAPRAVAALGARGDVAAQAVIYLRSRCIASPAVLTIFVASGAFRGFKDTRTPLAAAAASNVLNLSLDILLVFGLRWGVAGAALATSASQYLSAAVLLFCLVRKGVLFKADVRRPPRRSQVTPLLKAGVSLSVRSLLTISLIMYAQTMITGMGVVALAAHEILRQIYIFSTQLFFAYDIAAQSLVATYLGKRNFTEARQVLKRVLQIGTATGCVITLLLLSLGPYIPAVFTSDADVIKLTQAVLIIPALYMPLDAAAPVLDGGLLGAQDQDYVAGIMLLTSAASLAAMVAAGRMGAGLPGLWLGLKVITLGRVLGASLRYLSPKSPLGHTPKSGAQPASLAGVPPAAS